MTRTVTLCVDELMDEAERAAAAAPRRSRLRAQAFANLAKHAAAIAAVERTARYVGWSERECVNIRLSDRVWIFRTLVRACVAAGMEDAATRLADQAAHFAARVHPFADRRMCLERCVEMYLAVGAPDSARRVLEALQKLQRSEMHAADVASAMAMAGLVAEAETIARSIRDPSWKHRALEAIARAYAKTGDMAACRAALDDIPEAGWRAMALAGVAEALALGNASGCQC
ncbi:MAG: hypothetical protein M0006_13660 [Magnetospirillum sp.]|nr:hypothetical protein [Magnetospirillum sp.]